MPDAGEVTLGNALEHMAIANKWTIGRANTGGENEHCASKTSGHEAQRVNRAASCKHRDWH